MRTVPTRLRLALLLGVAAGCGGDPAPEAAPESPSRTVPRTVEKGDGCSVEITRDGEGAAARVGDVVTLVYDARVEGGETPVASTAGWDVPLRVRIGDPVVLPGLSRGLEGLSAGSKATIVVPPALAYGSTGSPASGIPADATLVFEVEVLGVRP